MPRIEHLEIEGSVEWKQKYIGKRQYEITHPDKHLLGAGAGTPVTATLKIKEWHRLIKIELKHCDANNDDSVVALTWYVERGDFLGATSGIKMVSYTASIVTDFIEPFGEAFEYPEEEYTISIDTTANHRLKVKFFIQKTR